MTTCRHVIDFLMAYLDGELPEQERAEFEQHLRRCPPCVQYLRSYEATVRLGKAALCESPEPAPVPEHIVQAVLAARRRN